MTANQLYSRGCSESGRNIRNLMLYPTELRAHYQFSYIFRQFLATAKFSATDQFGTERQQLAQSGTILSQSPTQTKSPDADQSAEATSNAKELRMTKPIYNETTNTIKGDFLYFIQSGYNGPIKIGRSKNPANRLIKLQTGNPAHLRLVKTCADMGYHEGFWHALFQPINLNLEWFADKPALRFAIKCADDPEQWIPHAAKLHRHPDIDQDHLEFELCASFEGFEEEALFGNMTERMLAKVAFSEVQEVITNVSNNASVGQIVKRAAAQQDRSLS